ncbi:hypothetical protein BZA05DRAFT_444944 [Tricharina praecox]|uniref:uncharacterized protein n=1 Tax=Tricharina praecox TaxID=43433 RepID=UPI00221F4760|nr:uncharacterized protein BZA05DRAFT_444944 [Tricharina praecox]KAI5851774.1 hypothetical protein BZA05DRAFT_444944 [Tricharina praecox]
MVAPSTPTAHGHLLRDRATIKAAGAGEAFAGLRLAEADSDPSPQEGQPPANLGWGEGYQDAAEQGTFRAATITTTTSTATSTTAVTKSRPKAIKYRRDLYRAGR